MSQTRARSVRVISRCEHCAMPMPLNGPVLDLECAQCGGANRVDRVFWRHLLMDVDRGATPSVPDSITVDVKSQAPAGGVDTEPPQWVRADVPSVAAIAVDTSAGASRATEPVVMQCPQCAGGLSIDASRPRTTTCEYCGSSVYLPDGLWRQFHPVEQARWWTVRFSGTPAADRHKAVEDIDRSLENWRKVEANLTGGFRLKRNIFSWAILWIAITLIVGLPSCGISTCAGSDPLFGLMGSTLCPRVCDTCTPPIKTWSVTTNGKTSSRWTCLKDGAVTSDNNAEIPGYLIVGMFFGFWAAVASALWLGLKIWSLATRGARIERVRARIAELEQKRVAAAAAIDARAPP